jgi:hypothetical protein
MKNVAKAKPSATEPSTPLYAVTLYRGARDARPAQADDLTWDELADTLEEEAQRLTTAPETASREEQKKCLLAFSPHALRHGTKRAVENVEAVTALVLDVDNDQGEHVSPEEAIATLEREGWAAVVYASPSDSPAHRKFRIVSPIAEPISPGDCRESRLRFAEALGLGPARGSGVTGAIDASKIFFVGRLHGSPARAFWRLAGDPVDVAALEPCRLAWGAAQAPRGELRPLASLPPASDGIAAALGDWRAHDGRKWDLCGELGGAMRQAGYTAAACEAVIRAWLPPADLAVDVPAGVAWALAAWAKPSHEVTGADALTARLGAEHGAIVAAAVRAGSWVGRALARKKAKLGPQPGETWPAGRGEAPKDFSAGVITEWGGDLEPIEWYCEGLCLAPSDGKISLVAGLPGAGKGPLADYLAACFATGSKAFGIWPCRRSNVLLLDAEGLRLSRRRIKRIARAMGMKPHDLDGRLFARDVRADAMLDDVFQAWLKSFVAEHEIGVAILDSYTSAMMATGLDPNKIEFANLAKAFGGLGILVISVAHSNKAPLANERPTLQQVSGSGALASMAATGIVCWHPDSKDHNHMSVACMRAPEKGFESFDVMFRDTPGDGLALDLVTAAETRRDAAKETAERMDVAAGRVLAYLKTDSYSPRSMRAVEDASGVHHRDTSVILPAMIRAGIVAVETHGARVLFKLANCQDDTPDAVAFDEQGEIVPAPRLAEPGTVGGFRR